MNQLTAHIERGWELAQKGDAKGAQSCAEEAISLDSQSSEAHNLLGFSKSLEGRYDEALLSYQTAIALDETYFEAMLNAAEILMHPLGEYDEALRLCEQAGEVAETAQQKADSLLLRIDALLHKEEKEAAAALVPLISSEVLSDPNYLFYLGRVHYELGDSKKALPMIEQAVKALPDSSDAWYYLGILREESGDLRGSIESFLRSRTTDLFQMPPVWSPEPEAFGKLVESAVSRLDMILARYVERADIYVVDLPGAEMIVEGVDPRILLLLDTQEEGTSARLFVYQRNVERAAGSLERMEEELSFALEQEVSSVFVDLEGPPPSKSQLN